MMRKKVNLFLASIIMLAWMSTILALSMPLKMTNDKKEENVVLIDSVTIPSVSAKDSIKNKLIEEAENYIFGKFPKVNKKLPKSIVEHGLDNEIDILFMMAQTQVETCFGTAGAGRETSRRSLFGVANKKYTSYDKAIQDYIAILKKSYLTKGRTEQHLMQKYVTSGGGRYATNPNYENELRCTYSDINKKTYIRKLQNEYRKHTQNT